MEENKKKEKQKKELPKEVAEKYNVLPGFGVGECNFKGQTIHMDMLTVAQADELVKKGFKALVPKKAPVQPEPKK